MQNAISTGIRSCTLMDIYQIAQLISLEVCISHPVHIFHVEIKRFMKLTYQELSCGSLLLHGTHLLLPVSISH